MGPEIHVFAILVGIGEIDAETPSGRKELKVDQSNKAARVSIKVWKRSLEAHLPENRYAPFLKCCLHRFSICIQDCFSSAFWYECYRKIWRVWITPCRACNGWRRSAVGGEAEASLKKADIRALTSGAEGIPVVAGTASERSKIANSRRLARGRRTSGASQTNLRGCAR